MLETIDLKLFPNHLADGLPLSEVASLAPASELIDWQAVLEDNQRWLRTVIYARLGEREATEEVLQEVALAAVRQSAPIHDESKVAAWLYRVAIRQVLLFRRKMGRLRKLNDRYAEKYQPTELDRREPNPLGWLIAEERRGLIRQSIGQLKKRDREILLLKYTEGWNYHQIAQKMGLSHSAVEARLHRARQKLRAELARCQALEEIDDA
jgi:RNA polymerase sigma factor (sigma-70 family)